MSILNFKTPPPSAGSALYESAAEELRQNPGQWAVITLSHLSASSIIGFPTAVNNGRIAAFPQGQFEARSVKGETFIRFVGEQS